MLRLLLQTFQSYYPIPDHCIFFLCLPTPLSLPERSQVVPVTFQGCVDDSSGITATEPSVCMLFACLWSVCARRGGTLASGPSWLPHSVLFFLRVRSECESPSCLHHPSFPCLRPDSPPPSLPSSSCCLCLSQGLCMLPHTMYGVTLLIMMTFNIIVLIALITHDLFSVPSVSSCTLSSSSVSS